MLFTKSVLRKLLRQEIVHSTALSSHGLRAHLDGLLDSEGLDMDRLQRYQGRLAITLSTQKAVLDRSRVTIDALMLESLKLAYAQLPERCVCLLLRSRTTYILTLTRTLPLYF